MQLPTFTEEEIEELLDGEQGDEEVEEWLKDEKEIIQGIEKWLEEKRDPEDPHHSQVTSPEKIVLEYFELPHAEAYSSLT